MKIFEIILKILFTIGSVYTIKAPIIPHLFLVAYLLVCFILGFVLIFNKKQSYGYELSKREIIMRRIEGVSLIAFTLFIFLLQIIY